MASAAGRGGTRHRAVSVKAAGAGPGDLGLLRLTAAARAVAHAMAARAAAAPAETATGWGCTAWAGSISFSRADTVVVVVVVDTAAAGAAEGLGGAMAGRAACVASCEAALVLRRRISDSCRCTVSAAACAACAAARLWNWGGGAPELPEGERLLACDKRCCWSADRLAARKMGEGMAAPSTPCSIAATVKGWGRANGISSVGASEPPLLLVGLLPVVPPPWLPVSDARETWEVVPRLRESCGEPVKRADGRARGWPLGGGTPTLPAPEPWISCRACARAARSSQADATRP